MPNIEDQHNGDNRAPDNGPRDDLTFALAFRSARNFITAAQIMAVASLIIGGVALSCAAAVISVLGYRKVAAMDASQSTANEQARYLLRRSAIIAMIMSMLALVTNAVALIVFYPSIMEMLQSGDYGSYFGMGGFGNSGGSTSGSFWG